MRKVSMIAKTIHLFTEKEEELVSLLVRIGTTKNVAKVLVYLANLKNATALEIEQGTDLRQPDVSVGLKYLEGRGWVEYRKIPTLGKGRPAKLWTLKMPIDKILEIIGGENASGPTSRVEMIRKIRKCA